MNPVLLEVAPGVWKTDLGTPECFTPLALWPPRSAAETMAALPRVEECPFGLAQLTWGQTARGFEVHLPLLPAEQIYGLGLQLLSFNQRGLKKTLRVNSDPRCDLGDSHAPVPFYVTTAGYGVLVDTARYATYYCGSVSRRVDRAEPDRGLARDTAELYRAADPQEPREVIIEIPGATGAGLYIFAGPEIRDAVQRYNLFSGGGCVPPRWALGFWYRMKNDFTPDQIEAAACQLREEKMPCDVIGLEPGWQSQAYSCSHTWNERFTDPRGFIARLRDRHYQVNLWTHAFTHPSSPIHDRLLPYSGDCRVFGGLVPDFSLEEVRKIFWEHYRRTTIDLGISGLKIDECDNSDFIHSPWSFPELSRFPSDLDGEQMHSLFGVLLQSSAEVPYRSEGRRTFGLVRNSHAMAAPLPFALYSDLYDHRQFVRGIASASFCGLLWSPEVREAASGEDLVRRLQSAALSPLMQVNGWYIANPPWKQWSVELNNKGELAQDCGQWQATCREILELRMRLVPYLHSAFLDYRRRGIPPFRAMVLDYPEEKECWNVDDQFMIGDRLLAAPLIDAGPRRRIWIPPGRWADFWTGDVYDGGGMREFEAKGGRIPLLVKGDSVFPLALPSLHTEAPEAFQLEVNIYGSGRNSASLLEDPAEDRPFSDRAVNVLEISWEAERQKISLNRANPAMPPLYTVSSVRVVQ